MKYDFSGENDYSVDEKGRILVPTEYRSVLAENEIVMLARGDYGQIDVYPRAAYESVLRQLETSDSVRFRRKARFMRAATPCAIDRQWRISIPNGVREHAQIANRATVTGNRDHFELWHPDAWKRFWGTYVERNAQESDDLIAFPVADDV